MKNDYTSFFEELQEGLKDLTKNGNSLDTRNTLKIDLHCHDYNSNKPDEILGRILNVPETWLPSETLIQKLENNGCNAFTITNHNNALSCWELKDKGLDILSGAEFTCTVPDFKTSIHVLAYGFNQKQEKTLNKLRNNIYYFQEYALENDIPTAWAHPLYFYSAKGMPPMDFFNKTALLFERFEVINGQRDTWQNLLTHSWLNTLSPEKIDDYTKKYDIKPSYFCKDPYKKSYIGGSDSHMGIFAGLTGTKLYINGLSVRKDEESVSELALDAIKNGNTYPFGGDNNSDKMAIAFLDYVCQIALNHKDPGLMRIALHKGSYQDKLLALLVTNSFGELRKHKVTMKFIELFHKSFLGISPHFTKKWFIPSVYKPVFDDTKKIAVSHKVKPDDIVNSYNNAIYSINNQLNKVFASRLQDKIQKMVSAGDFNDFELNTLVNKLELPSELRSYLDNKHEVQNKKISKPNINKFLDGLSFPFLASSLILAANFTSARVMYNTRTLLNKFTELTGKYKHPNRMLWLTDTFEDNNGVSMVLQSVLKNVRENNLPIDILIASDNLQSEPNLVVIKPLSIIDLPVYATQPLRIPNFMEIHKLFLDGGYDRIIVSTEGPMSLAALYLKYAFSIPAYFYIHTDWMVFAKKTLGLEKSGLSRLRRILRTLYNNFDGIFVLNSDQRKWLTGKQMNLNPSIVYHTSHWVDDNIFPRESNKKHVFNIDNNCPVMLYAGRVSKEKGVNDLQNVFYSVKENIPDVKLVVAGTGPYLEKLKKKIPEAIFMGWVNHNQLPDIYSSADILLLPSKFDTFSMVVLEALSCGTPVAAYNNKGPKDIIIHNKSGYLIKNHKEMAYKVFRFFEDIEIQQKMKKFALERAKEYNSEKIMNQLLTDVNLVE